MFLELKKLYSLLLVFIICSINLSIAKKLITIIKFVITQALRQLLKVTQSYSKLLKVTQSYSKLLKVTLSRSKLLKVTLSRSKLLKVTQKLLEKWIPLLLR